VSVDGRIATTSAPINGRKTIQRRMSVGIG
jgi:hypothetical protein